MKTLKIFFIIIVFNVSVHSQSYQTMYNSFLPLSRFQSHHNNFNSKNLLIFQHIAHGSILCNPSDTLNGNTFIINQVTNEARIPFNSAFQGVCCQDRSLK